MKISNFDILTFDTYGTLIDWETGIYQALEPLLNRMQPHPSRDLALEAFGLVEHRLQQGQPGMLYSELLAEVFKHLAVEWDLQASGEEAAAFGRSVKNWPVFDDTPTALKYLRQHFRMATLTNCDRISYMGSNARLEIEWDAIYTAQDIGSYKPSPRNFDFLLDRVRQNFGIFPHKILHVAQSLTHDHVPATRAGLTKAWIHRRHDKEGFGATIPPEADYTLEFEFNSMDELVAAHMAELD